VVEQMGRMLIVLGGMVVLTGALLMLVGRFAPEGRLLPGDIVIRRPGFTFYMPLATMIVLSLALSGLMWLITHLRR